MLLLFSPANLVDLQLHRLRSSSDCSVHGLEQVVAMLVVRVLDVGEPRSQERLGIL